MAVNARVSTPIHCSTTRVRRTNHFPRTYRTQKGNGKEEEERTLRFLVLHDVVGDGRAGVARIPIARRRRPGQQDRTTALLGYVQIARKIGRLLHEQVDRRLGVTVGVRGDADVIAAVHVARLHDPQLGGDASRCVRRIVHRVPEPQRSDCVDRYRRAENELCVKYKIIPKLGVYGREMQDITFGLPNRATRKVDAPREYIIRKIFSKMKPRLRRITILICVV